MGLLEVEKARKFATCCYHHNFWKSLCGLERESEVLDTEAATALLLLAVVSGVTGYLKLMIQLSMIAASLQFVLTDCLCSVKGFYVITKSLGADCNVCGK